MMTRSTLQEDSSHDDMEIKIHNTSIAHRRAEEASVTLNLVRIPAERQEEEGGRQKENKKNVIRFVREWGL